MSTARLVGRPAGLDELTAGAGDRRCRRLASTALLGMQEPQGAAQLQTIAMVNTDEIASTAYTTKNKPKTQQVEVEQGLGHFGDDVFTGQMTQPTVSKH